MILLSLSGLLLLTLNAYTPVGDGGGTDWIEGVAILAAVIIVVGVSSVTNYQKEGKFRELNTLKDDIQVCRGEEGGGGREGWGSVWEAAVKEGANNPGGCVKQRGRGERCWVERGGCEQGCEQDGAGAAFCSDVQLCPAGACACS